MEITMRWTHKRPQHTCHSHVQNVSLKDDLIVK